MKTTSIRVVLASLAFVSLFALWLRQLQDPTTGTFPHRVGKLWPDPMSLALPEATPDEYDAAPPEKKSATKKTAAVSRGSKLLPPLSPKAVADSAPEPVKFSPAQLWRRWEKTLARGDFQQLPILGGLLAEGLREHPDAAVYREIARSLNQSDLPIEGKSILMDLLGEIATPEALAELLDIAREGRDSPLYVPALQVISRIGDNRWDGRFHEELSPELEAAWSNLEIDDPVYAKAIARALATIGAPNGLQLLYQTLSVPTNEQKTSGEETARIKQTAAFSSIPETRNPAATEVVSQKLRNSPLGSPGFEVSGPTLVSLGTTEATLTLLDWAEMAPEEAARHVEEWLASLHDSASQELLSALQDSLHFQNSAVADAFATALAQLNSQNTTATVATVETTPPPVVDNAAAAFASLPATHDGSGENSETPALVAAGTGQDVATVVDTTEASQADGTAPPPVLQTNPTDTTPLETAAPTFGFGNTAILGGSIESPPSTENSVDSTLDQALLVTP